MRIINSKKGELALAKIFKAIISLVLIVEILIGIGFYSFGWIKSDRFQMKFRAKDIALLINAITIAPNTLIIDYPEDTNKLGINIEREKVSVYKPPKLTSLPEAYKFSEDKNIVYEYKELIPTEEYSITPRFVKRGNNIKIIEREYISQEIQRPVCNDFPERESQITRGRLATTLIEFSEDLGILENNEFISSAKGADIVIIITHSDDPDESYNPINIYVPLNTDKRASAEYLACLITNSILDDKDITKIIQENNLIEFSSQRILLTERYDINFGNIAILLEIGNINIPEEQNIILNKDFKELIKKALNIAIDNYG